MALFYFSIGATDTSATLKERLDGIREDGANISYTIVSANEVNLKINELTFTVRYNLIICKYNGALKCLNSVSVDGFSLSDLFNIPKGRYNISSINDVYITRALINPNLASANAINISDNLYLSTNLINVGVKTIVKSKEDTSKQFINVGGVFYLPYSASILTISSKEPSA